MNARGVVISAVIVALEACAHSASRDTLVGLARSIAPATHSLECQALPDTLVKMSTTGPFTLCTVGGYVSPAVFALIQDGSGRAVWVTRNWKASPEPAARAAFDSLTRELTEELGPFTRCDDARVTWTMNG